MPTPNPGTNAPLFKDVSVVSSTDVWAIGTVGGLTPAPFSEHWNGNSWKIVPIQDPTASNNTVAFTGGEGVQRHQRLRGGLVPGLAG